MKYSYAYNINIDMLFLLFLSHITNWIYLDFELLVRQIHLNETCWALTGSFYCFLTHWRVVTGHWLVEEIGCRGIVEVINCMLVLDSAGVVETLCTADYTAVMPLLYWWDMILVCLLDTKTVWGFFFSIDAVRSESRAHMDLKISTALFVKFLDRRWFGLHSNWLTELFT